MKGTDLLNDRALVAASAACLALVFWVQKRFPKAQAFRDEDLPLTLLRIACGLVLTGASLDKIGDPAGFLDTLKECYAFIPQTLQPLVAVTFPWVEFFAGLCLLFRFHWRAAALVFVSLMAAYTLAVAWDALRGIDCDCGCFSKANAERLGWWTVVRDLLFLGMGLPLVAPLLPSKEN